MRSATYVIAALLAVGLVDLSSKAGSTEAGVEKLGKVEFVTSCNAAAQPHFGRAVALLHSFWFDAAGKAFDQAAAADPGCAIAHWGTAMTHLGNPLAAPPSPKALADGLAAVQRAEAAQAKTQRERDYIGAVALLYRDHDKLDQRSRALAYEAAMVKLAAAHADDREAKIFHALALNMTALPTDKTYSNQLRAAKQLEAVFAERPDHPGVAHYLIHSYDYPPIAKQGITAARRYAEIAPSAEHALHMPSHVFTRVGYWQDSIASNRASAELGMKLTEASQPGALPNNGLHAMDYMVYAHLQLAQDQAAKRTVDWIAARDKVDREWFAPAFALAALPARYALERHDWAQAAALKLHPSGIAWDKVPQAEAVHHFARGLGAARSGNSAGARQAGARLTELQAALVAAKQGYWADQVGIQAQIVGAWASLAEGRRDQALAAMSQAADAEDATEKHIVTPGPLAPARELLGQMLIELGQPAQALAAFEASHRVEPNRFHGLAGAARAAELANQRDKARDYYGRLVALAQAADGERPEIAKAKAFLASK